MRAANFPVEKRNTEATGELSSCCPRNRQTNLDAAPYRLRLERTDGNTAEVLATRAALLQIACAELAAALGGWAEELRRRAYSEVIAPGYFGPSLSVVDGDAE
ncbi:hypothetical protein [uncultured Corynebacterium sp.]|uniref:hypothetical protein n=1 Tax=uncultured Corynebacterium sp. TaxID=159447 RepID=UPI00259BD920|nr:hypothetical protein [uncultured Corynebacterium sp.]MDL0403008.1 hypothetical protein [Corynebacterium lehmanniae]